MTDEDLTIQLCELLGQIPGWSWSTTDAYPPGRVGVFYGTIPDAPDRAVGVRVYGGTDNSVLYEPTRNVQLIIRGARNGPNSADHLASLAFLMLQGRARHGGINHIARTSFGPLGADGNGREQRSENYLIMLDNLEAST